MRPMAPNRFRPRGRRPRVPRIAYALAAALATLSPAHADEGVWTFDNPPAQGAAIEIRLHAQRRVARNASAVGGSPGRRIGLVRFARRAGADQSPRRRGLPAVALDGEQRYRRQRLLRAHARRGAHLPGDGIAAARVDGGCHRQGPRCGQVRHRHDGQHRAQRRHRRTRKRVQGEHRPALRDGDALSRRRLPPLSLQDLDRRAPGVRAGRAGGAVRRRHRQLRLSALRSRLHVPARL